MIASDVKKHVAYMIMDASQPEQRRYWNGHGWRDDPFEGMRCRIDFGFMPATYRNLVDAGCQVAYVQVTLSRLDDVVITHNIRLLHKVTNVSD
jgi:hypothetical protein